MTRTEMRGVIAHVAARTRARAEFLCEDRRERAKGEAMDQGREVRTRLNRLEAGGAGGAVGLWDRVNELGAHSSEHARRLARLEAALDRLASEHECSNPDGKAAHPCAVCGMAAALVEPEEHNPRELPQPRPLRSRAVVELDRAGALDRAANELERAELASEPTVELPDEPLFSGKPEAGNAGSSSSSSSSGKRKGR